MRNDFFGMRHPFFIPLWRRVLTVVVCLAWAALEFASGNPGWGALFGGIGLLAAYGFFVGFDADEIRARAEKERKNG